MKKLFAVLLALGLIVAFSATASAVDVKFGGSYYIVGVYDNNPSLREDSYSRAYFWQRIRLQPEFKIAEGLTFTVRMDAMEKQWDQYYSNGGVYTDKSNFDWERGWVTFKTGIGQFDVGYQIAGAWGTLWADNESTKPRIKLTTKAGPMMLVAIYEKHVENNLSELVDADMDAYYLAPLFPFKGGIAGVLYGYINIANPRPTAGYRAVKQILYPFFKATFGPVYVESELNYIFGKAKEWDNAGTDVDYQGWGAYAMAKMNFGPAAIGAQVGWSKGDIDATDDKDQLGPGKGADWNPALILMNDWMNTWSGGDVDTSESANSPRGLLLFNIFADYKVTPKFSLGGAFTYAKADKVPEGWDKDRGMEFDVTATYKLYDNLSYMVGAGYLFAGDYYKSGVSTAKVDDDYILMNKLTLTF